MGRWGNREIGIAEDIHEVSVGEIAGKVGDHDAVSDGVVDGAGLLSGWMARIWGRIIGLWQTRRAASGLAVMKTVAK